jgi:hypothetical protein
MVIGQSDAGSDIPAVLRCMPNQARSLVRWLVADNSYEVGFGRPPKHTQFHKGRSGNPKGRPKGSKNIYALIQKVLEEKVVVKGPGRTHSISKFEAALTQQVNKAAGGDAKVFREVLRLREKYANRSHTSTPRRMWSTLLNRQRRTAKNRKGCEHFAVDELAVSVHSMWPILRADECCCTKSIVTCASTLPKRLDSNAETGFESPVWPPISTIRFPSLRDSRSFCTRVEFGRDWEHTTMQMRQK